MRRDADVIDELGTGASLGVGIDGGEAHDVGGLDCGDGGSAVGEWDELAVLCLEAEVTTDDVAGSGRADGEDDLRVDVA